MNEMWPLLPQYVVQKGVGVMVAVRERWLWRTRLGLAGAGLDPRDNVSYRNEREKKVY